MLARHVSLQPVWVYCAQIDDPENLSTSKGSSQTDQAVGHRCRMHANDGVAHQHGALRNEKRSSLPKLNEKSPGGPGLEQKKKISSGA